MTQPRTDLDRLDRTLNSITIGAIRSIEQRKVQQQLEALTEREEHILVDVEGRAEEFPSWQEVDLDFDVTFVNGSGMRDSDILRPVFTFGTYIPQGGPVGLLACVTKWKVNDRDETHGCVLAVGAVATDVATRFRGELHAVFSGYGAPTDVYGDLEAYEGN